MSEDEIDAYLATLDEPKRTTLAELRKTILSIVPDAEQCISYGMPAFRVNGKVIAGFAAFKNHLSYLPHSGSVLNELPDDVAHCKKTPGSLHFPIDTPLPRDIVRKLLDVRLGHVRGQPSFADDCEATNASGRSRSQSPSSLTHRPQANE